MKVRKRTAKDYRVSRWSGGETREFLLFPDGASYAGRDFLWRVSSATVELAESDFTPLPDYRRFLTPLSGALRLSQNGGAFRALGALEVLEFDGGAETKSRGEVTDFNLMLRKGKAEGGASGLSSHGDHFASGGRDASPRNAPSRRGGRERNAFDLLLFGCGCASAGRERMRLRSRGLPSAVSGGGRRGRTFACGIGVAGDCGKHGARVCMDETVRLRAGQK